MQGCEVISDDDTNYISRTFSNKFFVHLVNLQNTVFILVFDVHGFNIGYHFGARQKSISVEVSADVIDKFHDGRRRSRVCAHNSQKQYSVVRSLYTFPPFITAVGNSEIQLHFCSGSILYLYKTKIRQF